MKKTLFPLAILGLVFASPAFAQDRVTNIVKVIDITDVRWDNDSDGGNEFDVITPKGKINIFLGDGEGDYFSKKSADTLYKAYKTKSCVKITQTPGHTDVKKVTCPKKLDKIKYLQY